MYGKSGQMALIGKQVKTPSPKKTSFSYRTKACSSKVDETLFGAPTRFLQQVETKRQSHDADWDPPWSTGPNSKGTPLLWTPFDFKESPDDKNVNTTPKKSSPQPRARSSSASRMKKIRQTNKTFSDTTTNQYRVGGRKYNSPNKQSLNNGAGDASSATNRYNVDMQRLFNESPVTANTSQEISMAGDLRASKMRLDLDGVSKEATSSASRSAAKETAMPVIRSRAGSNLGTKASKMNRHENSPVYDDNELENETVTRALRLANQSKQAYNSLQPTTTPLSTPRSNRTPRAGAPASPRIMRIARLSDFTLPLSARKKGGDEYDDQDDDNLLLSATGRSVPLSARSNASSRPSSARSRSSRRNSASGLRPSWKP